MEAARAWRPARIVVAEGTAAFGPTHESAFPDGGWREMAARQGVELYNLEADEHVQVTLTDPRYPHPLPISRLVLEADLFITVPLLKTHISADYTVALKNSFALMPQVTPHRDPPASICWKRRWWTSTACAPPDLIVVDGWDGAEGIAGGTDFERPAGARRHAGGQRSRGRGRDLARTDGPAHAHPLSRVGDRRRRGLWRSERDHVAGEQARDALPPIHDPGR